MPCYHPLTAYRTPSGDVVFSDLKRHGGSVETLQLPCGQCVGCRLERSRGWAVRCMHEASLYDFNTFITLTYRDSPDSLEYRDFQLFMKRLRKRFNVPIRFYMCGEYGEELARPHFHALLFGFDFPDRKPLRLLGRSKLFSSELLEEIWGHGHCAIGEVTFESAAYVARYCMKKVTGDAAEDHYRMIDPDTGEISFRTPEFNHMSLKPGIGANWIDKYVTDVYPDGKVVARGIEMKSPKYYDRRLKKVDPYMIDELFQERVLDLKEHWEDQTVERLAVREKCAQARVSLKKRS